MTVTDQLKITDNKIKAVQLQYDLDTLAAKISAYSSGNLRKYEYLTGEDLGYKQTVLEQARFEYSPLANIFNTGLKEEDKKERLLKRLRNIEGKNEEKLKAIEDQGKKQLDAIKNIKTDSKSLKAISFFSGLSPEARKLLDELKKEINTIDPEKLVCAKFDGTIFNFNTFKNSLEFALNIYHAGKTSLEEAKKDQYKMLKKLKDLEEYDPKYLDKINSQRETLISAEKIYNNRDNVIKAFENGIFPFKVEFQKKESDRSDNALPKWVKVGKKKKDSVG